jgi:hypothetical protein
MQIQALKEVKNAISQEATRFSGYQQHVGFLNWVQFRESRTSMECDTSTSFKDAHEFLCQVLDQLKEDIERLKKKAEISDNKMKLDIVDPVVSNFEFQVVHSIKCTK